MRVIVGINHPAHVHLFKNLIYKLKEHENKVLVIVKDKEFASYLLRKYNIRHIIIGNNYNNLLGKFISVVECTWRTLLISIQYKPDIFIGRVLPHLSYTSFLLGKPFIAVEDTENARLIHLISEPFIKRIITPLSHKNDYGKKHIRYKGYDELSYLHPNHFNPDISVLESLGLKSDDKIALLRFVSWDAYHDIGHSGLTMKEKTEAVKQLSTVCRVFISSETPLPENLSSYSLNIPPEKIHDLMYYSDLYYGESATMATEAAILGIPSIFVSPLVDSLSNPSDLYSNYKLLYNFKDGKKSLEKAIKLLDEDAKKRWFERRNVLLSECVDVTAFWLKNVESYK